MPLDPVIHANEYKKVADEVHKTSPITITKIQRIQNPALYRVYMVKKDQMEQKKGSNERTLFHGTAEGSCASINKTGFNRSYCGKNGKFQLEFSKFTRTCKISHFCFSTLDGRVYTVSQVDYNLITNLSEILYLANTNYYF